MPIILSLTKPGENTEAILKNYEMIIYGNVHYITGYRVFPGGKERPGRDVDPSPPSSAVVKKGYSYTSIPLWVYGLYRASVPVQG